MPNVYCHMGTIKASGSLSLTGTSFDDQLLRIAEMASRELDKYCDRFFYMYEGTFYQDGGATRVVLDFDVQTISTMLLDIDGDGTYETSTELTTAPVDFFLYPQNITPKTRIEANPWGTIGHLAAGIRNGIQITGVFGHGNDWPANYYHAATTVVGVDLTSTDATLTVSTGSSFYGGMTLRVGTEQMYVTTTPTGTTLAVTRAQNGTVAGTATISTAVYIYDYPQSIVQACLIQTTRSWKRRESGYVNAIINTDMGNIQVFKGLDPDVKEIVNQYRRIRQPRYIG